MAKKLTHDQKRKAKLKKRAERSHQHESLAYGGDKYKKDKYALIFFETERAIFESHVLLDRELTDNDVQHAIEHLVVQLRKGMPLTSDETEGEIVYEDERDLLVKSIHRRWAELSEAGVLPGRDDLIGILRTTLNSIGIWSMGGARPQGYLHYIEGFMKRAGVSVRVVDEDWEPLPDPTEDPLLAIGRPWIVKGEEAARADFDREVEALIRAGDLERVMNVCEELLGEAEDASAVNRLPSLVLPKLRSLGP